jgi:hypothetical protein
LPAAAILTASPALAKKKGPMTCERLFTEATDINSRITSAFQQLLDGTKEAIELFSSPGVAALACEGTLSPGNLKYRIEKLCADVQRFQAELDGFDAILAKEGIKLPAEAAQSGIVADSLCHSKYKTISDEFYTYNEKSAASNAAMDRITTYYIEGSDVRNIHKDDARAWKAAIEAFVSVGQPILQNLLEFKELGCQYKPEGSLTEMITKVTEDLKYSRARLTALINSFPPSAFQ